MEDGNAMLIKCAALCLILGQVFLSGVQGANDGCETCSLCDDRAFNTQWFFTEMTCNRACIGYVAGSKKDGQTTDGYCAPTDGFEKCRGKGNDDKCDCIRKLCNGAPSFSAKILLFFVASLALRAF